MRCFFHYLFIALLMCSTTGHTASAEHYDGLQEDLGQLIMIGFYGTQPEDPGVQRILEHIRAGRVGNIILFSHNISSREQLVNLTRALHEAALNQETPLFIALDQEGGKIQRLHEGNGFKRYKSAEAVAKSFTPDEAYQYYAENALGVRDLGINLVLGPVVDLQHHPVTKHRNPAIGRLERAFSADPQEVIDYAHSFIGGLGENGIVTCIKHFPGHGLAWSDSHLGFVDITDTYHPEEMLPFEALLQNNSADMVMTAHLVNRAWDTQPASLSKKIIDRFIRDPGFEGVIISDDLFMGAIQKQYTPPQAAVKALAAGTDIVILSANLQALKGAGNRSEKASKADSGTSTDHEALSGQGDLVQQVYEQVRVALGSGELSMDQLASSAARVRALKARRL